MKKRLVVVIDMVNGFINEGPLADKDINRITPNILKLIDRAKLKGIPVLAFRDCHEIDDEEFKLFPEHCLKGTSESELIPELKARENDFDFIIDKPTTNGFITKEFQELLYYNEYDEVIVMGCCTDICVLNFCTSYLSFIKENNLKTKIIIPANCVDTFKGINNDRDYRQTNALNVLSDMGAVIVCAKGRNYEEDLRN